MVECIYFVLYSQCSIRFLTCCFFTGIFHVPSLPTKTRHVLQILMLSFGWPSLFTNHYYYFNYSNYISTTNPHSNTHLLLLPSYKTIFKYQPLFCCFLLILCVPKTRFPNVSRNSFYWIELANLQIFVVACVASATTTWGTFACYVIFCLVYILICSHFIPYYASISYHIMLELIQLFIHMPARSTTHRKLYHYIEQI